MQWLENVLNYVNAPLSGEPEFRWLQDGLGTKYLLITCTDERPDVQIFGTREVASLLTQLSELTNRQSDCILLGVETWEVTSRFFRLDPLEAMERLSVDQ